MITAMERPNPDDDAVIPPDPAPASDPEPTPRFPKPRRNHDARPETLADNTKVTPLDDDQTIADGDGIEVNET
jgi:hypothetical protein